MSGIARLRSLGALSLLALGWVGLLWVGGEILSGPLSEARSHAAARSADIAALLGSAEAPRSSPRTEAEIAAAERAAREALLDSPLDAGSLVLLALAAEARADNGRASELMALAAERSPADLLARGWLMHHRLAADDFSGSLSHADAILRAQPMFLDALLPALAGIAADPQGLAALAELLAADPPWRGRFLERLASATADPLAPFGLFTALMSGSRPPGTAELRPYLRRLADAGLYEQARLLWIEALPADRVSQVGYLANGGFEDEPTGFLFDWSLEPVAGARSEIATVPDGDGGKALRIQFLDRRVAYRHVSQLLMLMPGRYRLSGRVKAENLRNARGLHWTLTCADQPTTRLGASERVSGTTRWQAFSVDFEVPAAGCRAQWLRLELAARIPSERHAAGAAWYDDLAVSRLDEPADDSCPDEGLALERPPALPAPASAASAGATPARPVDEEPPQCTCAAPVGTRAALTEVAGDVVVFRGEHAFEAERQADLAPGDRVMVRAGGRALLVQGDCRFDLAPQSVVTLSEDECLLCAAVVTAREVDVAYGQSAGGGAVGGGQTLLAPVTSSPVSPLSAFVVGLPSGETRPPASQ